MNCRGLLDGFYEELLKFETIVGGVNPDLFNHLVELDYELAKLESIENIMNSFEIKTVPELFARLKNDSSKEINIAKIGKFVDGVKYGASIGLLMNELKHKKNECKKKNCLPYVAIDPGTVETILLFLDVLDNIRREFQR